MKTIAQRKTKKNHENRLIIKRELLASCEKYKTQIENAKNNLQIRVILSNVSPLIDEINNSKVGGRTSFRHYIEYFDEKRQEVYPQ